MYHQLHDRRLFTDGQPRELRSVRLSAEIKAFTEYISPTDQEHELRSCVVESIRRLIVSRWRDAQVHAFGSFETRLYLPTGYVQSRIFIIHYINSSPDIRILQRHRFGHCFSVDITREERTKTYTVPDLWPAEISKHWYRYRCHWKSSSTHRQVCHGARWLQSRYLAEHAERYSCREESYAAVPGSRRGTRKISYHGHESFSEPKEYE